MMKDHQLCHDVMVEPMWIYSEGFSSFRAIFGQKELTSFLDSVDVYLQPEEDNNWPKADFERIRHNTID